MSIEKLEALVKTRALQPEPVDQEEVESLVASGKARLTDAENQELSLESRFDLSYNAAHALSLAAIRNCGYRSSKRYIVFQCLGITLGIPTEQWRVLDDAHRRRNNAEYEGVFDVNEELVSAVIRVSKQVLLKLEAGTS